MNVMLDLETLGTRPGSIITAIGAVRFSPENGISDRYYAAIDPADGQRLGFTMDASTVIWWMRQSDAARSLYADPMAMPLADALGGFARFAKGALIWGNGADFDNALLAEAYIRCGMRVPWPHSASRCFRTLKDLRPDIPMERVGTHHNALDDAATQALHALAIMRAFIPANVVLNHSEANLVEQANG